MRKILLLFLLASSLYADFHVISRCDLRWKHQILGSSCSDDLLTFRLDRAISLSQQKELYLRLDLPYMWLDCLQTKLIEVDQEGIVEEQSNPKRVVPIRVKENGLSDLLTKAFLTLPLGKQMQFGFGSELMFPTATAPEIGTGKYRARPMVGLEWGEESWWTALLAKYEFSFAGQRRRPNIQVFYLQPVLSIDLPKRWIAVFAPEMQFNCSTKKWFVPAAVLLAKTSEHFSASAEYKVGMVTDFPVFKHETGLTLSYLF